MSYNGYGKSISLLLLLLIHFSDGPRYSVCSKSSWVMPNLSLDHISGFTLSDFLSNFKLPTEELPASNHEYFHTFFPPSVYQHLISVFSLLYSIEVLHACS
jgi:hypothetical protein